MSSAWDRRVYATRLDKFKVSLHLWNNPPGTRIHVRVVLRFTPDRARFHGVERALARARARLRVRRRLSPVRRDCEAAAIEASSRNAPAAWPMAGDALGSSQAGRLSPSSGTARSMRPSREPTAIRARPRAIPDRPSRGDGLG